MVRWRLYYRGGVTFDSECGSWAEAPPWEVFFLGVQHPSEGRVIFWGKDFYLWQPDETEPHNVDWVGLFSFLRRLRSPLFDQRLTDLHPSELTALGVKFGVSVNDREFAEVRDRATSDPWFAPKDSWLSQERDPYQSPKAGVIE